jgi:diacylglycerol kinase
MKQPTYSLNARLRSFRYAGNGIIKFFRQEPNALLHFMATVLVITAAVFFNVSRVELMALVIVTGLVWVAEIFNTVTERVMDFVSPEYHSSVAFIKDLAAGAVLVAAIIAAITGLIVFIPKIV